MTIRELIDDRLNQIRTLEGDLHIEQATQLLVELSALMGNISAEIARTERTYHKKLLSILQEDKVPVNRAEIIAKTTDEYQVYREAKDYLFVVQETIRALKYRCKALAAEHEATINL